MVVCSGGDTTDACLDWAKTMVVFLQVLIKRPLKVGLMIFSIELPHSYHYLWPQPTFKVTWEFERSSKIIVFQCCHQCMWVSRVFPLFILRKIMRSLFFFLLSFLLVLACYCFPPVHAVRCLPATLQCESSVELSMWHLLTSVIAWITQESAVDPTTGAKQWVVGN